MSYYYERQPYNYSYAPGYQSRNRPTYLESTYSTRSREKATRNAHSMAEEFAYGDYGDIIAHREWQMRRAQDPQLGFSRKDRIRNCCDPEPPKPFVHRGHTAKTAWEFLEDSIQGFRETRAKAKKFKDLPPSVKSRCERTRIHQAVIADRSDQSPPVFVPAKKFPKWHGADI